MAREPISLARSCSTLACAALSLSWNGTGSILNSTSPFFIGRLGSAGTSITRPVTRGTICTEKLMARTSADDGAPMLSSRIMIASAMMGMVTTITCDVMFHGSHLNLMKISQTKKP